MGTMNTGLQAYRWKVYRMVCDVRHLGMLGSIDLKNREVDDPEVVAKAGKHDHQVPDRVVIERAVVILKENDPYGVDDSTERHHCKAFQRYVAH